MVSDTLFEVAQQQGAQAKSKSPKALRTISEVSELLDVPQHVLRFWETKFTQIKPMKRSGGRRFYRPDDIEVLLQIKNLLYKQGYTIKGAKKAFEKKKADNDNTAIAPSVETVSKNTSRSEPTPVRNTPLDAVNTSEMTLSQEQKKRLLSIRNDLDELHNMLQIRKEVVAS